MSDRVRREEEESWRTQNVELKYLAILSGEQIEGPNWDLSVEGIDMSQEGDSGGTGNDSRHDRRPSQVREWTVDVYASEGSRWGVYVIEGQ